VLSPLVATAEMALPMLPAPMIEMCAMRALSFHEWLMLQAKA